MPLLIKTRMKSATGLAATAATEFATAALAVLAAPSSRRDAASAVHASGAATGASPLEPVCNHDDSAVPTAVAEPDAGAAAALGVDVNTGVRCTVAATGRGV